MRTARVVEKYDGLLYILYRKSRRVKPIKNKILDGDLHIDPIDALKRKIFVAGMPVGVLAMLIVWGINLVQKDRSVLNLYALPILVIAFLVLTTLLWRRILRLRTYEYYIYALVLVYALGEFVAITIDIIFSKGTFKSSFALWLPFVYILGFLILDTNHALLFSAIFFAFTLILGLIHALYFILNHLPVPDTSLVVQVFFAGLFYIAVLYLVARIKERYASEHAVADDMSKMVMTDQLTQVYSRFLLNRLLREEINRAERLKLPLSLLLFDLDRFKTINDTRGHNLGDDVLHETAQLLRQHIRTSDPFGRWGGDEFMCLATNTNSEQAVELAERLRSALQAHHFTDNCKVTASFGITTYQKGDTPESLVRRADLGLYKAKADGRNRVEVVLAGVTLPLFEGEKPYPIDEAEGKTG